MPLWLTDYQDAGGCATQRQFAENILPILRVDNVYVLSNGLVLCGVCHRALRGIVAVHCHFDCRDHVRTPRCRELRRICYQRTQGKKGETESKGEINGQHDRIPETPQS